MNTDASSADDGSASPIGRSSTTSNMTPLPDNFEPGPDDVICGRGKKSYNHVGNERFRHRVLTFLDEYSRAKSKLDKSAVLSKVVYEVRQNSPRGGFIKQDTNGVWFEVGDFLAREKTSQAFRDALHDRYKSSNLSKKKRRQEEQAKTHQQTYSKMIGSEYDISSRLERLSSDVIGSHGIDSLDDFNRNNFEMLSRFHDVRSSPRQQSPGSMRYQSMSRPESSFRTHQSQPRSMAHFPDPLFGSAMNTANAMPSEFVGERLSPSQSAVGHYRSRSPQSLPVSVSSSEALPRVPNEVRALHHSLPQIDYFDRDETDFSGDHILHRSLPQLSLSKQLPGDEEDKKPSASDIEPVPFDRINIPGRIQPQQKQINLPPMGPAKKSSSPEDDRIPSASVRLSKDLIECLDKMTYHSIADDNPFEPIPLSPQQERVIRMKQRLSAEMTAELMNNPMDESERGDDEFAEG